MTREQLYREITDQLLDKAIAATKAGEYDLNDQLMQAYLKACEIWRKPLHG